MEQRSNVMGTVSLVCGIALIVCYVVGMCLGFVPFLGILALIFFPIDWVLALVGLITGIIGYSQSRTMDGIGGPPALIGAIISGAWILFQVLIIGLTLLIFGSAVVVSVIGAVLGNH